MVNTSKTNSIIYLFLMGLNLALAGVIVFSNSTNVHALEFNVLYTIQAAIMDSANLYTNPELLPYSVTQYMPFYHIVCVFISKILSLEPGVDYYGIYLVARSVAFFATLLTAVFLAKILHDIFDCDFNRSVLLGSLTLIITAPWNYLVRPDSFLTLFIVSALYFFLRYLKVGIGSKTMSLLIAGFLCFLAIFSKQTGIVILLILSSFLVLKLRFKDLITLFLGVAAGMAAGALMYMPFASPFVYANIIAGVDNGIHIAGAFHKPFMGLVTKFGAIFFFDIAAIYYIMKNIKFKQLDDTIQCVLYCFAALFAYSFLSSFKKGAGIHYFNDFYLISIIVCAYVYSMVEKRSMMDKASVTGRAFHQMSFIVIVALALSVTFSNVYQFGYPNFKILQYGGKLDNHTVVKFMMSEIEKDPDLLIIDQSSYRIFISRFPGNIAFSHPHIIKCCSYPRKVYDYSGVHDIVQRGRVKYLITESAIKNFIDIDLVGEFPFYKRISGYNVYMHKSYSLKG